MSESTENYTPPRVWQWDDVNSGSWSSINRPIAGATHVKRLPIGSHPLQLYSMGTPNGQKVTILLEELLALGVVEAEYDAHYIDILKGDQFGSDFVAINPNSKIPALVDYTTAEPTHLFESGAILQYLADKFGHFCGTATTQKVAVNNWLFWQMGSAPFLGGGFGHFYAYAPVKLEYPINRYAMEAKRQLDVLNRRLATSEFIAGSDYSIADIAIWPWYGQLVLGELYGAKEFLSVTDYQHVLRWAKHIAERPAVKRGKRVNVTWGPKEQQLRERHSAADFD